MYGFKKSMRVVFLCHQVHAAGKKSRSNCMKCRTRASIMGKTGPLSNGVDDLENFTSEMEWSFFCSRRFLLCFFKLVQLRINTACVSAGLEAARLVYLRGVNEYMTQQNALDLIVKNHPQFEKVYDAYQDVFNALKEKTGRGSLMFWKTTVVRVRTWTQPRRT